MWHRPNSVAVLESKELCATGNHLYNFTIRYKNDCQTGRCSLSVSTVINGIKTRLWCTALQDFSWSEKTVSIHSPTSSVKIVIEAETLGRIDRYSQIHLSSTFLTYAGVIHTSTPRPHRHTSTARTRTVQQTSPQESVYPGNQTTEEPSARPQQDEDVDDDDQTAVAVGVTITVLVVVAVAVVIIVFLIRRRQNPHVPTKQLLIPDFLIRKMQKYRRHPHAALNGVRQGADNVSFSHDMGTTTLNANGKRRNNIYESTKPQDNYSTPADAIQKSRVFRVASPQSDTASYSLAASETVDVYSSPLKTSHEAEHREESDYYSTPDDTDPALNPARASKQCSSGYKLAAVTGSDYNTPTTSLQSNPAGAKQSNDGYELATATESEYNVPDDDMGNPEGTTAKSTVAKGESNVTDKYNKLQHDNLAVTASSRPQQSYDHLNDPKQEAYVEHCTHSEYSLARAEGLSQEVTHTPDYVNVNLNSEATFEVSEAGGDYNRLDFGIDIHQDSDGVVMDGDGGRDVYNHLQDYEEEYRRLYFDGHKFEDYTEADEYNHIAGDASVRA
ncbi:hypothetical protein BaRGS_00037708 [Batillaria attramentaria]|uniref:MAM domain-containing protein n=1 Tax=Batillaria attramentaria TaxID=370345 RepID=A0ABD0J825_9CAEN